MLEKNKMVRMFELPYGFMIDLIEEKETWDIWLYHKTETIKEYLVGLPELEEAEAYIERKDIFTELVRYYENYMR